MKYTGVLKKMQTECSDPVKYYLIMQNDFLQLNQMIGRELAFTFQSFECLNCGLDKKIFRQGFCYDCFSSSAKVGDWIIRPELSTAHLGIEDRDLDYEKSVQLQEHVVYLAVSSDVKVGVTRKTQVPTRWIDQGASLAMPVVEVPNRYLAGITEVALKEFLSDKTDWRKMLTTSGGSMDLMEVFESVKKYIPEEARPFIVASTESSMEIKYPLDTPPKKVKSINLSKTQEFKGKLAGIKGQYLIFEDQSVLNVRNNEGFFVELSIL